MMKRAMRIALTPFMLIARRACEKNSVKDENQGLL